jgi:hypothetical protein
MHVSNPSTGRLTQKFKASLSYIKIMSQKELDRKYYYLLKMILKPDINFVHPIKINSYDTHIHIIRICRILKKDIYFINKVDLH